jgi:acylphosphatase
MNNIRLHVFISGRVQGVRFRENTLKKAKGLGVFGWVKNLPDGRVEAVFEGQKEKVEKMLEWSKRGPFFAKVTDLEAREELYKGEFNSFDTIF